MGTLTFRSRWTTPIWWQWSTASRICCMQWLHANTRGRWVSDKLPLSVHLLWDLDSNSLAHPEERIWSHLATESLIERFSSTCCYSLCLILSMCQNNSGVRFWPTGGRTVAEGCEQPQELKNGVIQFFLFHQWLISQSSTCKKSWFVAPCATKPNFTLM